MPSNFVEALDAEIQAIETELASDPRLVKLRELRRVRALYEPAAPASRDSVTAAVMAMPAALPDFASHISPAPDWSKDLANKIARSAVESMLYARSAPPRASPTRQRALEVAADLIRGKVEPTKTADIYRQLEERGIEIGGQNPQNNLSAMLYNARPLFKSHGRAGWTLNEPSEEAKNNEAADEHPAGEQSSTASVEHPSDQGWNPPARPVEPVPGGGT